MTTYATLDSESYTIRENATIRAFETRDDAEAYLRDAYAEFLRDAAADDEPLALTIEPGQYSDCWIKSHDVPTPERMEMWCEPFGPDDLIVRRPGEHPGGKRYWIEPSPEVLVAIIGPAS